MVSKTSTKAYKTNQPAHTTPLCAQVVEKRSPMAMINDPSIPKRSSSHKNGDRKLECKGLSGGILDACAGLRHGILIQALEPIQTRRLEPVIINVAGTSCNGRHVVSIGFEGCGSLGGPMAVQILAERISRVRTWVRSVMNWTHQLTRFDKAR